MPELPEVEVTRRGLEPSLCAHRVLGAVVRAARLRDPIPDLQRLSGLTLAGIERRAKYLIWRFTDEQGHTVGYLTTHLGMSGVWRLWPCPAPAPGRHDHVDLIFESMTARLTDPRRFSSLRWSTKDPRQMPPLSRLGPEPFDPALDAQRFYALLHGHRKSIKAVLLDGSAVVGCGNIYCSESLFRAGISPRRSAARVTKQQAQTLLEAIRTILSEAIAAGGSTLRDFHGVDGRDGYFALSCQVYGRAGEPCCRCGRPIRRIVQSARSSFFCETCQK